jgi:hypothetical protein
VCDAPNRPCTFLTFVQSNLSRTKVGRLLSNLCQSLRTLYTAVVETMNQNLIAPCGMNCGVCDAYLAKANNLREKGIRISYCAGCLPRGKNCVFMRKQCERLGKGLVRFCYECDDYPCRRLKALDKRYRAKYHMSQIENLEFIKAHGMASFLEKEAAKWRCPECGGVICCHNGLCFGCGLDTLRQNRRYRWGES